MKKHYLIIAFILISICSSAQDAKKMSKHLKVNYTANYDKTLPISFAPLNPQKHGFFEISQAFRNAFISHNFIVKDSARYVLSMEYGYIYAVARYTMQYSNLKAEIVDNDNNKTVIMANLTLYLLEKQ